MDPTLRRDILDILSEANDLTIATVREDGFPQATTVSFASEDLDIYFGTAATSQKSYNLSRDNRVSLTINLPYANWGEIRGLSASARAERLTDPGEVEKAGRLLSEKFPQGIAEYASDVLDGIAFFRVRPEVVSLLDYRKGFGHTELIELRGGRRAPPNQTFTSASWPNGARSGQIVPPIAPRR
jgi:hypothetical protein